MDQGKADTLSEWVKSGRVDKGMTQRELCTALGVTVVHVSQIENGRSSVSLTSLRKMCAIFGKVFVVGPEEALQGGK